MLSSLMTAKCVLLSDIDSIMQFLYIIKFFLYFSYELSETETVHISHLISVTKISNHLCF